VDLPPFLRQTVKTQLIIFCIEWRIEYGIVSQAVHEGL
jgi:hypothetical protein